MFLDVGDTLIHLKKNPADIYCRVLIKYGFINTNTPSVQLNQAFREAWKIMSLKNPAEYRDRYCNHPQGNDGWWKELIQIFLRNLGAKDNLAEDIFREIFHEFDSTDTWELDCGFPALLKFIKKNNIGLGIISNWDLRLRGLLTRLNLIQEFSPVIISAEFGYEKPSNLIFKHAERLSNVKPEFLTYVGDKPELDYWPTQKLGWDSYLISKNNSFPHNLKYIQNLGDLVHSKDWKI